MKNEKMTRRSFVGNVATSAFAFTIVPRHVLGGPGFLAPSDTVNVAVVGAGSQGMSNARALVAGGHNIAVLTDVDFGFVDRQAAAGAARRGANGAPNEVAVKVQEQYSKARRYADVRQMLEKYRTPPSAARKIMERQIARVVDQIARAVPRGPDLRLVALGGDVRFAASQRDQEEQIFEDSGTITLK